MTEPLDLDALKVGMRDWLDLSPGAAVVLDDLIAELRATRAERDDQATVIRTLNQSCTNHERGYMTVTARAERAEAEAADLEHHLRIAVEAAQKLEAKWRDAEAEVARVKKHGGECRECDGWHGCCEAVARVEALLDPDPHFDGNYDGLPKDSIRVALRGDQ